MYLNSLLDHLANTRLGKARNIAWVTTSRILSRGSIVVASMVLARTLDVRSFASFSYFLLTVSMVSAYASIGLGVAANRYFVGAANADEGKSDLIYNIFGLSVIFSLFAALIVLVIPHRLMVGTLQVPHWAIVLGVLFFSLEVVPQNGLNGLEKYYQDVILSTISAVIVVVIASIAAMSEDLNLAMLAVILGSISRFLGGSALVIRTVGYSHIMKGTINSAAHLRSIFNFSLPMFLVSLLASTGPWAVGRIIFRGSGGEHAFALYAIGLQWFSLGMFLPAAVSRISLPTLVRNFEQSRGKSIFVRQLKNGLMASVISASVVAVIGIFFSKYILLLYGKNYISQSWFVGIFLFVAIVASAAQMIGVAIVVTNNQWKWLRLNFIFVISMVVSSLYFVDMGAISGPISFMIGYSVLTILSLFTVKKENIFRF